ncbi:hypothetical protein [Marivirga harenae]|uniref:hypothetical protein n=1 Tax=Marivirga harenae TaxID=2010992 RepID=UPI0026DFE1CE|nr:hypothetical protein [Marivirga harenae]WKV11493.1 hypothetical protein Q3Y49_14900 [Marivirga harenae]
MSRNKFSGAIYFIIGSLLLVAGIIMLVFDITKVGNHYLTQQQSAVGGFFVIFVSLIILIIGYFCLSPFSKIREFIEGTGKRKR